MVWNGHSWVAWRGHPIPAVSRRSSITVLALAALVMALVFPAPLFIFAALDVASRPPKDYLVDSPVVPIGTVVQSTEGGGFTVLVRSIQCDWTDCSVRLFVTNKGPVSAAFPCDELSASGPSGTVLAKGYDKADSFDHLGTNTRGCALDEIGPGQSASMTVLLFQVHDQELDTLTIPGADQTVSLPPVERNVAG